jgi:FixJ family two-component response regulator
VATQPVISVVDDDESVRESLLGLIRSVGFAVQGFASADEFINSNQLRSTACLILDVRMPGMRGPELQRWLADNHHDIPIIFITAHGDDEEARARALRDGALAYLFKPLSEEALLDAVQKALSVK